MKITFATAVALAQKEEMERDERVFVMGEDVAHFCNFFATDGLADIMGENRVINTPISETAIAGAAFGAAISGLRPVAEIMYGEFFGYVDPLLNHIAKTHFMSNGKVNVPMVLRLPSGGKGGNGAAHSQNVEMVVANTPGLKIVAPSSASEAKGLLKTAIRDDDPVVFIEEKLLYPVVDEVSEDDYTIPFGKARIAREGSDVTIVSYGYMTDQAIRAARELKKENIEVEIVDLRTLNPLDIETPVQSALKTGRVIVAHQACTFGGFGGEIVSQIQEKTFGKLKKPILRVGALSAPVAANKALEHCAMPDKDTLVAAVKEIMN